MILKNSFHVQQIFAMKIKLNTLIVGYQNELCNFLHLISPSQQACILPHPYDNPESCRVAVGSFWEYWGMRRNHNSFEHAQSKWPISQWAGHEIVMVAEETLNEREECNRDIVRTGYLYFKFSLYQSDLEFLQEIMIFQTWCNSGVLTAVWICWHAETVFPSRGKSYRFESTFYINFIMYISVFAHFTCLPIQFLD